MIRECIKVLHVYPRRLEKFFSMHMYTKEHRVFLCFFFFHGRAGPFGSVVAMLWRIRQNNCLGWQVQSVCQFFFLLNDSRKQIYTLFRTKQQSSFFLIRNEFTNGVLCFSTVRSPLTGQEVFIMRKNLRYVFLGFAVLSVENWKKAMQITFMCLFLSKEIYLNWSILICRPQDFATWMTLSLLFLNYSSKFRIFFFR